MDLFCFLPVRSSRIVRVCACAFALTFAGLVAFAQSATPPNSQPDSQTSSSNASSPVATPGINNPKTGSVSSGNYIPPVPSTAPEVYYDRPWEVYAGATYTNFLAGPALIQRSNLGGWEAQGSYWRNWHWGLMADARQYIGTSGVFPNPEHITGPRITQYYFMAGPEYRLIRRSKGSATIHAIFGEAYGVFDSAQLLGLNVQTIGLFATQWTLSGAFGGTFDYNYTPRIAFRVQPEVLMTHYGGTAQQNFGFSVGPVIRLGRINKQRYGR